ncbi:MAG: hypothetical protein EGR04_08055, partial [Blautia sp.]|nr:hypothetical protein [Blautia sp.]
GFGRIGKLAFQAALKNKEVGQTTTTQEITIRKEEGKWKVVVDENLQNAIFPGLSEAVNGSRI